MAVDRSRVRQNCVQSSSHWRGSRLPVAVNVYPSYIIYAADG